ncbi:MAG: hypothetical protein JNN15_21360, partial [Blastocatellia bacterium]|nr:hypothetical protein [Blastocatellia bacterium]
MKDFHLYFLATLSYEQLSKIKKEVEMLASKKDPVTLGDGTSIPRDIFLQIIEERLNAFPQAEVIELNEAKKQKGSQKPRRENQKREEIRTKADLEKFVKRQRELIEKHKIEVKMTIAGDIRDFVQWHFYRLKVRKAEIIEQIQGNRYTKIVAGVILAFGILGIMFYVVYSRDMEIREVVDRVKEEKIAEVKAIEVVNSEVDPVKLAKMFEDASEKIKSNA